MKPHLLFVVLVLFSFQVFAYPITPRPLRKLIIESEFVIHGFVKSIGTLKSTDHQWNDSYAVLEIKHVLKGIVGICEDTIVIEYPAGLVCPAPPVYEKGAEVIVFLNKNKKTGIYETHALSYGVRTFNDPQNIPPFKQRVNEMIQIQKLSDNEETEIQTIDWLVKCVKNPSTRWDGLYELNSASYFMSYYDNSSDKPLPRKLYLTSEHKNELLEILATIDMLSHDELGLIDVLYQDFPKQIMSLLKDQLLKLRKEHPYFIQELMIRIANFSGNKRLVKLAEEYEDLMYDEEEKKLNTILEEFLKLMQNVKGKEVISTSSENVG